MHRMGLLVVQWLRLRTSSAGGIGLTSGPGTKIPRATWQPNNKKNAQEFQSVCVCDKVIYLN